MWCNLLFYSFLFFSILASDPSGFFDLASSNPSGSFDPSFGWMLTKLQHGLQGLWLILSLQISYAMIDIKHILLHPSISHITLFDMEGHIHWEYDYTHFTIQLIKWKEKLPCCMYWGGIIICKGANSCWKYWRKRKLNLYLLLYLKELCLKVARTHIVSQSHEP